MPTIHVLIRGRVQGVFFRASAREVALALDLKGWVKNTKSGEVEATVTGSEKALQQFIDWCRRGPEKAVVSSLNVTAINDLFFPDFRILRG